MDNEPLSNRGKFAVVMVFLVITAAVGMRVYRYYHPLQMDSIFIEDTFDYEAIEAGLFDSTEVTTENVNTNSIVPEKTVTSVVPERGDTPAIERIGTRTLTAGQAVEAVAFQDTYIITFERDDQLFSQIYSSTWELLTTNENIIDTTAAVQRQLVTDGSNIYLFSLRHTDAGYQLDVKQLDSSLHVQSDVVLFSQVSMVSAFVATVHDDAIYVYNQTSEKNGTFASYSTSGAKLTERTVSNYHAPVALTVDQSNDLILTTSTSDTLQFVKLTTLGEEVTHFSITLEETGYVIHDFVRWGDYVIAVGSFDSVNNNYSQLLIWSQNLDTQYPSIYFNKNFLSPNLVTGDAGVFLIYVAAETTNTNATEVTTYTVQVDQLARPTELLDSSL